MSKLMGHRHFSALMIFVQRCNFGVENFNLLYKQVDRRQLLDKYLMITSLTGHQTLKFGYLDLPINNPSDL